LSLPRMIILGSVILFIGIGTVAIIKKNGKQDVKSAKALATELKTPLPQKKIPLPATQPIQPALATATAQKVDVQTSTNTKLQQAGTVSTEDFPSVDRMQQLFGTTGNKLPIVETISYTSRVDWLKGRPAWIADYATHYATSRHFIARSLNGRSDYFTQKVSTASRFNVFRRDKEIQFYLLVDVSRCKMGLYYLDVGINERVLLKTYDVGLGRPDAQSPSGCLTPLGIYSLGSKIAIYKPGVIGQFMNKSVEMVRVFGTRWIPFEQEFEGCTAPAKGLGFHGAPYYEESPGSLLIENRKCIRTYDSDGCIRLNSEDVEEIFSIVITKPSFAVIVKDFRQAKLPGVEVTTPSR